MTVYCETLIFLLVLAICILTAYSETHLATRDAEEEEEDDMNIVAGNESFKSTTSPIDAILFKNTSTSDSLNEDDLPWLSDTNFSDHEILLRTASSKEATFENGIERESEEEAHLSSLVDVRNTDVVTPISSDVMFSSLVLNSQLLLDNQMSSTSIEASACDSADKCELYKSAEDKNLHSTAASVVSDTSMPLWNIVRTTKSNVEDSLESGPVLELIQSTSVVPTSQSSTAQTSDNLIPVERTSDSKDEIVPLSNHSAKSEKSKQAKPGNFIDSERPLRTVSKIGTFPESEKESDSATNDVPFSSFSITYTSGSPVSEAEYVIAISDKIITPTVEYVYYVNQTELSKSDVTRPSETASSIPDSSTLSSVQSRIAPEHEDADLNCTTPQLLPSFTETYRSAPESTSSEKPFTNGESKTLLTPPMYNKIHVTLTSTLESKQKDSSTVTTRIQKTERPITDDESSAPAPRLSNPGCSSLPICVEFTLLQTTWEKFCLQTHEFRQFLSSAVSSYTRPVHHHQIVLDAAPCITTYSGRPDRVSLAFYVTDDSGEYEETMTEICGVILRKKSPATFGEAVLEVGQFAREEQHAPAHPVLPEVNSGFVAAVTISSVAGVALCLLCVLLVVVKQRFLQSRTPPPRASPSDAYSLDSLSINASFRRRRVRRSGRSYLNHAFDDHEIASHPLNEKNLMNCLKDKDFLEDEFKKIPMNTAKLDEIPEGADVKNRYSNVLPKPETRVIIAEPSGDPLKSYINANYVKGYDGKASCYIACQAPLPEGIEDFWRMVWEQQSRVIIMLTMFEENGVSRCAPYFPQSSLVTLPPFGDFQISLLKKEVYEFYTMSTFRLFDLERNLFREVTHLWYMTWPAVGVPNDPSSLVTFMLQCRPFVNCNSGPTVVHCSTGTGRSGVFLALDICMREYDDSRSIDILQCVSQLRRDRGGAVQNKDQYVLIYEAMLEYASRVANQSQRPSIRSNN